MGPRDNGIDAPRKVGQLLGERRDPVRLRSILKKRVYIAPGLFERCRNLINSAGVLLLLLG